jgi:hypothetical protein
MVLTGNGELGFNSREAAWETATLSKEGGTAGNIIERVFGIQAGNTNWILAVPGRVSTWRGHIGECVSYSQGSTAK